MSAADYRGVAVAAPVSFGYARYSRRDTSWYFGRLLATLLQRAGIQKIDVDGLAVASYTLFPDSAAALADRFGLCLRWLEDFMIGGTSAMLALRRAARAVQCGDAEIVACLGADAMGKDSFAGLIANFSTVARDYVYPYGAAGPNAVFGMVTQHYMAERGLAREDFGRLCITQRANAAANPHALLRRPLSMDQYLNARPIATPLHLFDCVMPCCGGEGFLVLSEDRARRLGLPFARIEAAIERHNAYADDPIQTAGGWAMDADALYEAAAIAPTDIDFLQAYDDYPVVVMMQLENLGLCGDLAIGDFVRNTDFTTRGAGLPLNTNGGQLSVGQAGGAGGFVGLVEGIRQLTGETAGDAVPEARLGLVSGYGMVNYRHGLTSAAAILSSGARA